MKFKMAERSLFAVLLRSPWWISFVVAIVFVAAARALLPDPYFSFGAIGCTPFVVIGCIAAWRQFRALSPAAVEATLQSAATLSWRDFGNAVEAAYQRQGYTVTRLAGTAADFSVRKDGRTTLVSAKRWKAATVGLESLRELAAARKQQDASFGQILTLGNLSDSAATFARENAIQVQQGSALATLLHPLPAANGQAAPVNAR